jgi:uncharacterized membrane protein
MRYMVNRFFIDGLVGKVGVFVRYGNGALRWVLCSDSGADSTDSSNILIEAVLIISKKGPNAARDSLFVRIMSMCSMEKVDTSVGYVDMYIQRWPQSSS